jgi:nitrogenase molybdenum-iron protein alpha/beta subunit
MARFAKKKKIVHTVWVSIFSTSMSEKFLILGRTEQDIIKKHIGLHLKYPLCLSNLNEARLLSTD